jgi:nucleotide-binding universal stress UspA family protein
MFTNVIVGVDAQPGSRDAIALGTALAADGGTLTLAHVHGGEMMPMRASTPDTHADESRRARRLLVDAHAESGVEAECVTIGSPSVGQVLHELADRVDADLLVMGSCRRGLIGRVLVSDDTQSALNGAPCAVAVAPAGYAGRATTMREIGVGYNVSPESRHALAVARELAAQRGARLSAFEAVSLPAYFFVGPALPVGDEIGACVEEAHARIAALGGVEPHAAYGAAGEELTVYSASLDLLVVGSRGYGPVGRMMHGSISLHLARTARCPLLVLPRDTVRRGTSGHLDAGLVSMVH